MEAMAQPKANNWNIFTGITLVMFYFIALVVFMWLPFQVYTWAKKPFPGFVVEQTLLVGVYSGTNWGGRAKLEHLQQVISLNDRLVGSFSEYNQALKGLHTGQVINIAVIKPDIRDRLYQQITVMEFPRQDLLRFFWLPYGVGILYFFMGLWVFIKRGNTFSGQAFTFFSACTALASALLFDLVSTHTWVNLWSTAVAQLGGALILVGFLFPDPLPWVRKRLWLLAIPLLAALILTVWSAWVNYDTIHAWRYVTAWSVSYLYAGVGAIIFVSLLVLRLRLGLSAEAIQQVRITLWGTFFSFLPMVFWFLSPSIGFSIPWNPVIFLPSLIIFPLSIGLAIVRYRLWDFDIIINRTLVYSLLSLMLIGIFVSGIVLVDGLILGRVKERSPYSIALSSMVIAIVFNPLRNRIQRFIDRRFFRVRYDTARTIESFSLSARQMVDLDQLQEGLIKVLQQTVQPTYAKLCVCTQGDTNQSFYIDQQDPLHDMLLATRSPLDLEHLSLVSPALEALQTEKIKLTIPLINRGELIGVINLGKRRSGQPYTSDDQRLLQMLAAQMAPALRVAQLVRQYQAQVKIRQRIEQEMELAKQVQESVLRKPFPEIRGFTFAARNETARQVGGDFYDVIFMDEESFGLVVADVSDKGIPAALYMAMTRSLLVSLARRSKSPRVVMQDANNLLQKLSTSDMFVTVFYAVINQQTLSMYYTRAGHDLPMLLRQGQVYPITGQGMALGVFSNPEFSIEECELQLAPGDRLVLYTDGLTDVLSPDNTMFGSQRLKFLLGENSHLSTEDFCTAVFSHLTDFRGSTELFDDMTMLVIDICAG